MEPRLKKDVDTRIVYEFASHVLEDFEMPSTEVDGAGRDFFNY